MLGAGVQPAGTSPAGFGAATQNGAGPNVILPDPVNGGSYGSRLIDPVKRDYVMNQDGRLVGMSNVHQLVQIAVVEASTELQGIQKLDGAFELAALRVLTARLSPLVTQGLIDILGVTVRMNEEGGLQAGQAVTNLQWRDRTTNEEFNTPV